MTGESRNALICCYGGVLKINKATKLSCSKSLFLWVPCTLSKGHFRLCVWMFYCNKILHEVWSAIWFWFTLYRGNIHCHWTSLVAETNQTAFTKTCAIIIAHINSINSHFVSRFWIPHLLGWKTRRKRGAVQVAGTEQITKVMKHLTWKTWIGLPDLDLHGKIRLIKPLKK